MIFRRFFDAGLAQASYLIGCESTKDAIVIDPNRDVEQYIAAAAAEKLHIRYVTDTHIHADYVSGARELAHLTGAALHLSAEGGNDWQYAFAAQDGVALLHDGDVLRIGRIRVDVLHTPGHTPEHLAFLVTDEAMSDRPVGIVSGDFVFVGDVGRPDLLERAANFADTMRDSARVLYRSLERFRALPDYLQLWPGHGAGSACGKALGAMPQSTIGYEKIANWALAPRSEEAFVEEVLAGQPEPPTYFADMKRINRDGAPMLNGLPHPPMLDGAVLADTLASGTLVIDTRSTDAYAAGFVPGTLNVPLSKAFSTYAGWFVPYDQPVCFIADSSADADLAARELAMIGLDHFAGWFPASAVGDWATGGRTLGEVEQRHVSDITLPISNDVVVIDVRNRSEWEHGHIPGAIHIPMGHLPRRLAEIPRGRPIVVHCQGGSRSAIGSSVLLRSGIDDVHNLRGGFAEWERQGKPIVLD